MKARDYRARARQQLGGQIFHKEWLMALLTVVIVDILLSACSATVVAVLVLAGPLTTGLCIAFLKQARNGSIALEDAFGGFTENFLNRFLTGLMYEVFLALWTCLFIVPGIIKSYSYAMTFYVSADHPEYTWDQCITASRKMMDGHKWQLFCLQLSFIGWIFVGACCCGIGSLWVAPYMNAAMTQFYLDRAAESENA